MRLRCAEQGLLRLVDQPVTRGSDLVGLISLSEPPRV
jgi:hypothetical protein